MTVTVNKICWNHLNYQTPFSLTNLLAHAIPQVELLVIKYL